MQRDLTRPRRRFPAPVSRTILAAVTLCAGWGIEPAAAAQEAAGEGAANAPILTGPITEGATEVGGYYSPSGQTDQLILFIDGVPAAGQTPFVSPETRTFRIELSRPLAARKTLRVDHRVIADEAEPEIRQSEPVDVDSAVHDWGRARSEFSFGVMASKERDDFSKTDLYLDFLIDYNWKNPYGGRPNAEVPAQDGFSFLLNSYMSVRLSSIPVAGDEEQSDGGEEPVDQVGQFLASRKAAVIELGVYAPMYGNPLSWDGDDGVTNALFIGPIAKFAFQSITDEVQSIRDDPDDLFEAYSGGVRVGHLQTRGNAGEAPVLVSYLDVTVGFWENFERCEGKMKQAVPVDCVDGGGTKIRPWRIGIVGRLQVPETPLVLGIDLNTGPDEDDVRFMFATRFDIGRVFARLGD